MSARRIPRQVFNLAGLFAALLVIFAVFCVLVPHGSFYRVDNLQLVLRECAIIAIAALGMTFVIVSGGIDLSIGSVTALTSVIVSWFIIRNFSGGVAFAGAIVGGALCGLLNGLLITKLKVGPFIVTLGTLLILRAVGKGVAHETQIEPSQHSWLGSLLNPLKPDETWRVFPWGVWLTIVLAVLSGLALRYTRFGRHVVAVGSNEAAARLCGVPTDRVKIWVYILSGISGGLAGVLLFSKLTVGDPTSVQGMELDVIAAVVIGGASLSGGEGTIVGTIIGALIMQTIRSGGTQMGLSDWIQDVVTGSIIVLAVGLDRWRMRRGLRA